MVIGSKIGFGASAHGDCGGGGSPGRSTLQHLWFLATLAVLLGAAGCGLRGPQITVSWRKPKLEVKENTPLRYQSVEIGGVEQVQATTLGGGTTVTIRLRRKYAHYVREKSTFVVEVPAPGEEAYIDLVPLDADSPPAQAGAVFQGAETRLEATGVKLLTDWKRTLLILGLVAGVLVLLVVLTKIVFKLWVLFVCVAAGVAGVYLVGEYLTALLAPYLPANVPPNVVGAAAAFLAGYIVGTVILGILVRPFRHAKKG